MKTTKGFIPNVLILSVCFALGYAMAPMAAIVGGIVGSQLAPSPQWATLPFAMIIVGIAVSTFPASSIMRLIGRRNGFSLFAVVAGLACLTAAYAIHIEHFLLYCAGMFFIGAYIAFAMQFRFAAAESVDSSDVSKAISLVLAGGVAASILGPQLTDLAKDWLDYGTFTGSFVVMAGVQFAAALLLRFMREVEVGPVHMEGEERPLRQIISEPKFLIAVMMSSFAFALMNLMFAAAPISMHVIDGFSVGETALVIQSHVMAMFLPSFFAGFLIEQLGILKNLSAGIFLMLVASLVAIASQSLLGYWVAIVANGLGWNLLFLAGTSLLTQSYNPAEKYKAQGANDAAIFITAAVATLSSGAIVHALGWTTLAIIMIPVIALLAVALVFYWRSERQAC